MGTVTDKLNKILSTKTEIKNAIIEKGVDVSDVDTFASYPDKIRSIQSGGGGDEAPTEYYLPLDELPDLENILTTTSSAGTYRYLVLIKSDGYQNTSMYDLSINNQVYTSDEQRKTSSGTGQTITWDTEKDIVLSDGSRWRWILFCLMSSPSADNQFILYNDNVEYLIVKNSSTGYVYLPCLTPRMKNLHTSHSDFAPNVNDKNLRGIVKHLDGKIDVRYLTNLLNAVIHYGDFRSYSNYPVQSRVITKTQNINQGQMYYQYCNNLRDIVDDTSKATKLFFSSCFALKNVDNIDYTSATDCSNIFSSCSLEYIDHVFGDKTTDGSRAFNSCYILKTINTINFTAINNITSAFTECYSLKNINNIIGEIKISIDFGDCKVLSLKSVHNIINALQKKTSGTYTLTLPATVQDILPSEDKTMITEKGWTVAWR